jgi:serine/threonine protein kinase
MTSTLRRVSTQASTTTTSSRITPSVRTRRSTDSRVLEEVLHDGDLIGPGECILGQPIHIIHARTPQITPMKVIRKLGAGSYAVVYLAQEILPRPDSSSFLDIHEDSPPTTPASVGRYFAIKCLAKHAQDQDAQLLEATIHQSLPVHDNVVTLWHTLETASYLLLILDYVPGEDLFYFLEQARDHEPVDGSPTTPPTPSMLASLHPEQLLSTQRLRLIASMFSQMCEAVAHCHRNGVFHRDIKPENFMVTDSRSFNPITGKHERKVSVKLTDFGLATRDTESGDMDCGSAPYMSFECHNNITPTYATAPADVWSLGIVLINMLYHANPWLTTA